jgi:hypothetical protein
MHADKRRFHLAVGFTQGAQAAVYLLVIFGLWTLVQKVDSASHLHASVKSVPNNMISLYLLGKVVFAASTCCDVLGVY